MADLESGRTSQTIIGDIDSLHTGRRKQSSMGLGSTNGGNDSTMDIEKMSLELAGCHVNDPTSADGHPIEYRWFSFETELPSPLPPSSSPSPSGTISPQSGQSSASTTTSSPPSLPEPPKEVAIIDPTTWTNTRKNTTLYLACTVTMMCAFAAGAYPPGQSQMMDEWNITSPVVFYLGITTFTCGFAVAPMFLAPFSELNGRKPVFLATGILFAVCQIFCAITRSFGGMLAARFFVGFGGSTFSTMVGGVVGDLFRKNERNAPMAVFAGTAILGTGLGPFVSGFVAQNVHWRWLFWVQAIIDGALVAMLMLGFQETRGDVLLSRKARALNKWYEECEKAGSPGVVFPASSLSSPTTLDPKQEPKDDLEQRLQSSQPPVRIRWQVAADANRANILTIIRISLTRPFLLLVTEPILFSIALWVSFSWMMLYLTLGGIPYVYVPIYNLNIQTSGSIFAAVFAAPLFFTPWGIWQERMAYARNWFHYRDKSHTGDPEHRLLFVCGQGALLPVGLLLFGWCARPDIHPVVSALGLFIATCGILSIYLATFNYLADAYGGVASSAIAATSFCRNIAGGVVPLFTMDMFDALGPGRAGTLLAGCGVLLGFVPWILVAKGEWLRRKSRVAVGGRGGNGI